MKRIYIFSPQPQTGKTTVANQIAYELAELGKLVCVFEFNRYTSQTIHINGADYDESKSLTNLYNREKLEDNLIQSKHHEKMFYSSKVISDELNDLFIMNDDAIEYIIQESEKGSFDYIILDLPSNYIEKMLFDGLSSFRNHDILVTLIDENLSTLKLLKDYDNYLQELSFMQPKNNFCIKNKTLGFLDSKLIQEVLSTTSILNANRVIELPYIRNMTLYHNENNLIGTKNAGDKLEKEFVKRVKELVGLIDGSNK